VKLIVTVLLGAIMAVDVDLVPKGVLLDND
jgi:hypothetical protein